LPNVPLSIPKLAFDKAPQSLKILEPPNDVAAGRFISFKEVQEPNAQEETVVIVGNETSSNAVQPYKALFPRTLKSERLALIFVNEVQPENAAVLKV